MRMFRAAPTRRGSGGRAYCCQEDGMVGLGCGARSYTRGLHYSLDYAVGARRACKAIIADYLARDADELRHRRVTASRSTPTSSGGATCCNRSCNVEGLDAAPVRRTASAPTRPTTSPTCRTFADLGLLEHDDGRLACRRRPGLERSDALGPWLFSDRVRGLMAGYAAQ